MSAGERKPVPGLRSPRDEVKGLVYFGRMVDKIRLEHAGKLPKDYHENMGKGFDGSCCEFLGVGYERLRERVRQGGSDEELLAWCGDQGKKGMPPTSGSGTTISASGAGGTTWQIA